MTDLVLSPTEQRAMRHLLAARPCPGTPLPPVAVLEWLAVLIPCESAEVAFHDRATGQTARTSVGRPRSARPARRDTLDIEFSNGPAVVVRVRLVRLWADFGDRDRAMATLLAPALARLVHERPAPGAACLTAQERAVLGLVATGASNAEIARDLCIAESTVRKHLEHSYRKLGVTGRLAAVARLQRRDLPGLDLAERVARTV